MWTPPVFTGQDWVRLQQPVNWQPGQLVAVTTSVFRDEVNNLLPITAFAARLWVQGCPKLFCVQAWQAETHLT